MCSPWILDPIRIWKCWFLRSRENWSTWRKTFHSQSKDKNQQKTQPTKFGNQTWVTLARGECSCHCTIPAPPWMFTCLFAEHLFLNLQKCWGMVLEKIHGLDVWWQKSFSFPKKVILYQKQGQLAMQYITSAILHGGDELCLWKTYMSSLLPEVLHVFDGHL